MKPCLDPAPAARPLCLVLLCLILWPGSPGLGQQTTSPRRPDRRPPTFANVAYGPHARNVLDLYLPQADGPTPLVLFIHGGGFRGGDKRAISESLLSDLLDQRYGVASLNYRLTDTAPAPAAYEDCARALQFLRHTAKKWNLDPRLVASTGGSAGAGTSLWLAFHDDLADPDSEDPIRHQSTRLICAAVFNGQSSYDPLFAEQIGIPRPNFDRHPFFLPFYDLEPGQIDTDEAYRKYRQMAPVTYLTADDPPVLMDYSYPNEPVQGDSDLGLVVHHPLFGIDLQKRMAALGIKCAVQYRDPVTKRKVRHQKNEPVISPVAFIKRHFDAARE